MEQGFSIASKLSAAATRLDELVETSGERSSHPGTEPIDPMVSGEFVQYDVGAEGSSWVEGTSGVALERLASGRWQRLRVVLTIPTSIQR